MGRRGWASRPRGEPWERRIPPSQTTPAERQGRPYDTCGRGALSTKRGVAPTTLRPSLAVGRSDQPSTAEGVFSPGTIEIGWRLAPQFWGNGYVTEMAKALIEFGLKDMKLDEILSFAVPQNTRSINVMQRIGMSRDPARDFKHPAVPNTHKHLQPHVSYVIQNPAKKDA